MKKTILLLIIAYSQLSFSQSNQTSLDDKTFYLGNSFKEVKEIFNLPEYSISIDSTLPHLKEVYIFKNINESIKILGDLTFIGDKLTSLKRYWNFNMNTDSYSDFENLFFALKSNFENGCSVKIDFYEKNEPNAKSKLIGLRTYEKDIEIEIQQKEESNSVRITEEQSLLDYNIFDYDKKYYLTFIDFEHLIGEKNIINEFYYNLDEASKKLREYNLPYLSRGLPYNGNIVAVFLPKKKNKDIFMDLDTLFNDGEKLTEVLNNESDTGCILVTSSFLDRCLMLLLNDVFIKSSSTVDTFFKLGGLLNDFSNKAKLCYSLSLIDKNDYCDLIKIAEIRNLFAHSHILLDFNDSTIQSKCNELKGWEDPLTKEQLKLFSDNLNAIARQKYIFTATNIINKIMADGYLKNI
jgi:DNA-binding MltR family transcriptional regulator